MPGQARPEVVAHRGASHDAAEHTLGAYRRAMDAGADALECDVRLTADGHLVCVHDRRVDRTSTGSGLVSTLELAHLEGLDWASWHDAQRARRGPPDPEVPDRDRGRILTLNRLLGAVHDSGNDVRVAIETKHPTRYAGLVERRLVELLDRFGWAHPRPGVEPPVRVMSFSTVALMRVRALAPQVPLVQLVDRMPLSLREGWLPGGVTAVGVSVRTLRRDPRALARLRRQGTGIHVWTVDEREDVARCVDAGVEAIITNRPAHVVEWLGRRPTGSAAIAEPPVSPFGSGGIAAPVLEPGGLRRAQGTGESGVADRGAEQQQQGRRAGGAA